MDPTGFIWMGARYYDPQGGRFISPDPLGHSASMDLYSFAHGDPINYLDPTGMKGQQTNANGVNATESGIAPQIIESTREKETGKEYYPIEVLCWILDDGTEVPFEGDPLSDIQYDIDRIAGIETTTGNGTSPYTSAQGVPTIRPISTGEVTSTAIVSPEIISTGTDVAALGLACVSLKAEKVFNPYARAEANGRYRVQKADGRWRALEKIGAAKRKDLVEGAINQAKRMVDLGKSVPRGLFLLDLFLTGVDIGVNSFSSRSIQKGLLGTGVGLLALSVSVYAAVPIAVGCVVYSGFELFGGLDWMFGAIENTSVNALNRLNIPARAFNLPFRKPEDGWAEDQILQGGL
jgi:hypothetical protein